MDYCSFCRRNLNGVFVCPGCGAYAPDIAPPAQHLHSEVATTATTQETWRAEEVPVPGSDVDILRFEPAPSSSTSRGVPESADPAMQGRAARRRQLARWKKNRRRALAATAVALVGGGLTIAAMPTTRPSTSQTHAGAPPERLTEVTPRAATADTSSEQPDTVVPRQSDTRTSAAENRPQNPADATPPARTANRQPQSAATTQPSSPSRAATHSAPEPAEETYADDSKAPAPAPETAAPASTERPAEDTSAVNPPPPPATSPADSAPKEVCVLILCIG
ncbi:SCO2400 family protein [Streptomyces sp. NPDC055749]